MKKPEGREGKAAWPLVLGADDIINYPELLVQYANVIALDKSALKFNWKSSEEELKKQEAVFRNICDSLYTSMGSRRISWAATLKLQSRLRNGRRNLGRMI